jgi:hypothetical protein
MIAESFEDFLSESIRAEDAYRTEDAIQTVISGKRELAFVALTTQKIIDPRDEIAALGLAINRGLQLLPVVGRKEGAAFVVYRRNIKLAQELAKIASTKGGYLNDETPEEARAIGRLLDYSESDIDEYIKRRYEV